MAEFLMLLKEFHQGFQEKMCVHVLDYFLLLLFPYDQNTPKTLLFPLPIYQMLTFPFFLLGPSSLH
jgi:hypothetical protein